MADDVVNDDKESMKAAAALLRLEIKEIKEKLVPLDPDTPISDDKLRFVCISDTHGKIENSTLVVPPGDILLHAGDITIKGQPGEVITFNRYLRHLPHTMKVVIAGNHDITFHSEITSNQRRLASYGFKGSMYQDFCKRLGIQRIQDLLTNCVYLEDSSVTVCGIKIFGSPWSPPYFGKGAFQRKRGPELLEIWDKIEPNTDILMTHGPPAGYGDMKSWGKNIGCIGLLNTVQRRVKPLFHVFGHIHEGYGVTTDGFTTYINASTCSKSYKPINKPIVFDFPIPEGHSKQEIIRNETEI